MTEKTAGVLGGMGPDATVDFMAKVIALTDAATDQDHVRMLVDQNPKVPNRQAAIRGDGPNAAPVLAEMAKRLEGAGADFLVMPCNTAHVFMDHVYDVISIPFIHIIEESVREIERLYPDARQVGVMATDACFESGIYQSAIENSDRSAVLPEARQSEKLMDAIHRVKAGEKGNDVAVAMHMVAEALIVNGADVIIAGCTEIPLVFPGDGFVVPVISSTDVLARRTVALARGLEPLPAAR